MGVGGGGMGGSPLRPREDVEKEYKARSEELLKSAERESFREKK